MAAIRAANAAGVPVAFDLNYRSKLWSESEARACFVEIVPLVDILFASRGMLRTFFNIDGDHAEVLDAARTRLGLAVTILSRKRGKASRSVRLGSMAMGRDGQVVEGPWRDVEVVDRLGGGDAFAGGFIAGYIADQDDLPRALALGLRRAGAQAHRCPAISSAPPAPRSKRRSSRTKAASCSGNEGDRVMGDCSLARGAAVVTGERTTRHPAITCHHRMTTATHHPSPSS